MHLILYFKYFFSVFCPKVLRHTGTGQCNVRGRGRGTSTTNCFPADTVFRLLGWLASTFRNALVLKTRQVSTQINYSTMHFIFRCTIKPFLNVLCIQSVLCSLLWITLSTFVTGCFVLCLKYNMWFVLSVTLGNGGCPNIKCLIPDINRAHRKKGHGRYTISQKMYFCSKFHLTTAILYHHSWINYGRWANLPPTDQWRQTMHAAIGHHLANGDGLNCRWH